MPTWFLRRLGKFKLSLTYSESESLYANVSWGPFTLTTVVSHPSFAFDHVNALFHIGTALGDKVLAKSSEAQSKRLSSLSVQIGALSGIAACVVSLFFYGMATNYTQALLARSIPALLISGVPVAMKAMIGESDVFLAY